MNEITNVDREYFEALPAGAWHDCLFYDDESGEEFFVELQKFEGETAEEFVERCAEIANANFDDAHYCEMFDVDDAEIMGLDTY